MSGICGLLRLDGGPADGIAAMTALLERRGPDATCHFAEGPVALGHTLLATTPEALHEALPLTDPASGCVITADLRLDNREELMAALGLTGAPRVIGDGELVLRAYLAWGEACLDRLLGDFAFAIWDPRGRRLFAARDQMGMRPLAYAHLPGQVFAFATEPRAVIEAPGIPRDLDQGRIADFLEDYLEAIDFDSTFHRAVRRLPPAHCLTADAGGVTVRRYWSLVPGPPLHLPDDEAYAAAFLDVLTEAVRCRLRSAGPVGSMLSGGVDSGAVAAVASRLIAAEGRGPLPTFSVVGPDPGNVGETVAIRASQTMPGLDPHVVDIADLSDWESDLRAALRQLDEPFDGHMNLPRAAYLAARRAGVRVVLDGVAGDIVLTEGDLLPRLFRSGRLRALWREAVAEELFWSGRRTRWRALRDAVRYGAVPPWLRRLRRRLRRGQDARPTRKLLSPSFAREVDLAARVARWRRHSPATGGSPALERAAIVAGPALLVGRERYDRVAAALAVEPRDPFMDLRVIGFCLRCPASQMKSGGWPKVILRRALRGLLPEEVIWRLGRTHLGWSLTRELMGRESPAPPVASRRHLDLLRRATGRDCGQLAAASLEDESRWDLLCLALWLESARGPASAGQDARFRGREHERRGIESGPGEAVRAPDPDRARQGGCPDGLGPVR